MAKECRVVEGEPPTNGKPKRNFGRVVLWACLTMLGGALTSMLLGATPKTRVTVHYNASQLEFSWKCSTCGADNYIRETIAGNVEDGDGKEGN